MKIFYPVEVFYPSQAGGPANTVYWLAKNLSARGFEPVIVSTDKGINDRAKLNVWSRSEAGSTIFVKTRSVNFPLSQTLVSLRCFRDADVIHLSSVFYPAAFLTAFAARLLKKKIACSPRGELSSYSLNYSGRRKRPILWAIRRFIGTYSLFHSTSDDETNDIRKIFGDDARVVQIPNYVELEPAANRNEGNYLLHIGRIHPKKAIDNLIRSLALSTEFQRSNFILKIAGKGKSEYEGIIRNLITELGLDAKVQMIGQVEGEAKAQLLADAYLTIMPSHSENFGVVVLESLAQGTPVIASLHTPWSTLETEKMGLWRSNSPEDLAGAIDQILSMDKGEYAEYRSRGRDYVMREFDIRNHIEEWVQFYSMLE